LLILATKRNKLYINFQIFKQALQHYPIFSISDIRKKIPQFDRKRLGEWQQKGYLRAIARGFYAWPDAINDLQDQWALACKVYAPSYISLQSALSFYGFIPEGVFAITAVTTLKTRTFHSGSTNFMYRNIRQPLFFGYAIKKAPNGMPLNLAFPEKALLDIIYFSPGLKNPDDFEALRLNKWQIGEVIDQEMMAGLGAAMGGKRFAGRLAVFTEWLNG
jgi:predicted transcriptional regulator of viral defense system